MNSNSHSENNANSASDVQATPPQAGSTKTETVKEGFTFGKIFLRGLAISLPSILTLVIILWLATLVNGYIIQPTTTAVRYAIALATDQSISAESVVYIDNPPALPYCDNKYRITQNNANQYQTRLEKYTSENGSEPDSQTKAAWISKDYCYVVMGEWAVPYRDYEEVASRTAQHEMPQTTTALYMELVLSRYFLGMFQLSLFAVLILLSIIYFLGRVMTVRLGSWFLRLFERKVIGGLPVVRNVYSSVKQITDFLFSDNQIEYRRVVAIEYPRQGIWSLGFVTGESMIDIVNKAGEPCLSVLIPTSPMPMTGYTMSVPKSAVLDLNISVDQAFQFCVSCGVLVPPQQKVNSQPGDVNSTGANDGVNKEQAIKLIEEQVKSSDKADPKRRSSDA